VQGDNATRLLLLGILLCLVFLIARGRGPAVAAAPSDAGGRYEVLSLQARRGAPTLIRFDRATGRGERYELAVGDPGWLEFGEAVPRGVFAPVLPEAKGAAAAAPAESIPPASPAATPGPYGFIESPPTQEDLERLLEALDQDLHPQIKAWVVSQLRELPIDKSLGPLVAALDDEHPEVVVATIEVLAASGDPRTLPPLRKLLSHPAPEVQAAARRALGEEGE
jgi:hypothetical protein